MQLRRVLVHVLLAKFPGGEQCDKTESGIEAKPGTNLQPPQSAVVVSVNLPGLINVAASESSTPGTKRFEWITTLVPVHGYIDRLLRSWPGRRREDEAVQQIIGSRRRSGADVESAVGSCIVEP